jgi:hypothetical protein
MSVNKTETTNGMEVFESSLNANVDLFYKIGASRGKNITPDFVKAFNEDPDMALRIAQWVRDVRGGSGERQIFKDILVSLAETDEMACRCLMVKTPELGRWDDLLALMGTSLEKDAMTLIKGGLLTEKDSLCAKWMPRKGEVAVKLRKFMEMSPKQYRKTLVELTNVVETSMCSKNWDEIDFSKLPSVASARYQKAFNKNAEVAYREYKGNLVDGTAEIKAGAVYPYDVIKSLNHGDSVVADAQWKALPDYMEGSTERVIPVVDVSGSMWTPAGQNGNVTCLDVAVSLGLYIAEKGQGVFKDKFITFSSNPEFVQLAGNLSTRYRTMESSSWGMSTNVESVFNMILTSAKTHSVPESDMPTKILILSDMQFDRCTSMGGTFMGMITKKYEDAGYKVPNLVFWNINSSNGTPVTFDEKGTALVSGFSPAIMKSVLACESLDPVQMMKDTVGIERYDWC